jgi:enoyl-CoA hydratase/carnithine racemase
MMAVLLHHTESIMSDALVLSSTTNGVLTLTMNLPRRLNGWTIEMMDALFGAMEAAASDDTVGAVILTGVDPYYSAGVNLSSAIAITWPRQLREMIRVHNQALFDRFIEYPKPILIAVNGPAIGATATSATLCDAIIASEKASFSTPFAKLGVTPEGCSSVHLPRMIGADAAERMLGPEGWVPTAAEAHDVGLVDEVVPHEQLLPRAQAIAEAWVAEGRGRVFKAGGTADELMRINAEESSALADAFLDRPFLLNQYRFLKSRKKTGPALTFLALVATRPLWRLML